MADISKDKKFIYNDLIVFDKTSGSYIYLDSFYSGDETGITGFGDGRIETVKAGKTTMKEAQSETLYQKFNSDELRTVVAGFITSLGKDTIADVYDVFLYGTDQNKADLAYVFETGKLPTDA